MIKQKTTAKPKRPRETMRVMAIRDKRLVVETRPRPQRRAGEVLIRVKAAGVNRPDLFQRQGLYPPPPGASDIPGLEVAGTIVAGPQRLIGKKVTALVNGGGYAEYVAVPQGQCLPLPRGMDMAQAAALPETAFTVWRNVFDLGRLQPGETLFLHGGNSGIGTMAAQMAAACGASVIAAVRGEALARRLAKALSHVPRLTIIDSTRDWPAQAAQAAPNGIDVVLDMLGGEMIASQLDLLNPRGRHVSIASLTGSRASLPIPTVMRKELVLTGSTLRPQTTRVKAAIARALHRHIWPHVAAGLIMPLIDKTLPLEKAAAAHDRLEKGGIIGKIILLT